jgi:hypothetical protein
VSHLFFVESNNVNLSSWCTLINCKLPHSPVFLFWNRSSAF